MELAILIFRLFLAAIFGLAGIAKLADFSGTQKATTGFGVPKALALPLSVLLIAAELTVSALLLFNSASWYGAIGAAALLGVFVVGMLIQIGKGNAPDCHCFGQIKSEPVGIPSVVRNLVFLVPAVVLIYRGPFDQGTAVTSLDRSSIQTILLLVLVLLAAAAIDYLRKIITKQDEIVRRIDLLELVAADSATVNREDAGSPNDGLPIGALLPEYSLADLDGARISSTSLGKQRPAILMFVSATCEPCSALMPQLLKWKDELSSHADLIFVSSGDAKENEKKFGRDVALYLDDNREFAKAVSARWTPSAMIVREDGRVASHIAAGDEAITELFSKAIPSLTSGSTEPILLSTEKPFPTTAKVGDVVPEFSVETIAGDQISSKQLKGARTMFLFWGVDCPHCVAMAADFRKWETSKNGDSPNVIVFSDGDLPTVEDLEINSPLILEPGRKVAGTLGMYGTPSAILVDEEGRFASETAISAPHIWALVGHNPNK